ncbi:MAG: ABC transporter substrate-binding protein [Planctomycetota bacterium]
MKTVLVSTGIALAVAYTAIRASHPDQTADVPLMHWVTDPAPARDEQIAGFHDWLVDHGHTGPGERPGATLQLDANSDDQSKLIIQGVSGVASDLFDVRGGGQMRLFQRIGLLRDVTDVAVQRNFDPTATWPALQSEITLEGRQFMFPANAAVRLLWVNTEAFSEADLPIPPRRWTLDEFESLGREFIEAHNPAGQRQTVFFADDIPLETLYRSLGLSAFNETLTACDLDDPRYVEVLRRWYRWVYEEGLLPTPSQQQSMQGQATWGGSGPQMFAAGNYGLLYSGRYMVMQFRRMKTPKLAVVELPHGGFPNHRTTTRATAVYTGSVEPHLAELFLAYLASDRYNMQIVTSGDAMPPQPAFTDTEEFIRPAEHPNEWGCHEVFAEAMDSTAIGGVYSPYILQPIAERVIESWRQEFANGLCTVEEAAAATKREIDARIARNLERDPKMQAYHDEALSIQEQIDARLEAGQPIPAEWIRNPFYLRYYAELGLLAKPSGENRL